ncbi:MAG TPA: TRAP transporter substrate-binding protein [Burkholderiales bacterium]|nr:TRAP transporter substrate-binding protein [Burkholderiales bacterium]
MTSDRTCSTLATVLFSVSVALGAPGATAADAKHDTFGYDQPHTTGYGIAADTFASKLKELSGGTMLIDQFPGAQLGQEPQTLQKIRTGDIDFVISSTANAATVAPEAGVFSIHFIFRSEDRLAKALADPKVVAAFRKMVTDTVKGAHVLTLITLGMRDFYSKKEIHGIADVKGLKIRVQATPTEDALFPGYGAQVVHMPFGDVYTSLQTGVVDLAENGINVYLSNKHYEVAPIMSLSEHEANNGVIWVSDKAWNSFSDTEKQWVRAAADEVGKTEPAKAIALDHESQTRLEKVGVKFVRVDKSGFIRIAKPLQDKIAKQLGPHAVQILGLVRAVK